MEIQELRFLALRFHRKQVGTELRLRVTVHLNRRDSRFLHLLRVGVFIALFLIYANIVITQISVSHADDILFSQGIQAVKTANDILVRDLIDEGVHHRIRTIAVVLLTDEFVALHITDDGLEQFIRELAFLEFLYFREKQLAHLVQALLVFRRTDDIIGREVIAAFEVVLSAQQCLFLHDIDIHQTALTILHHCAHQIQRIFVFVTHVRQFPSHPQLRALFA